MTGHSAKRGLRAVSRGGCGDAGPPAAAGRREKDRMLIAGINNLSRSLSAPNRQTRMLFLGASGGRIKGSSRRRRP